MRKVWLAITGCYEDRRVSGVYASAEAAMKAHPLARTVPVGYKAGAGSAIRGGGWLQDEDGNWDNGLDWHEACSVEAYEVQE